MFQTGYHLWKKSRSIFSARLEFQNDQILTELSEITVNTAKYMTTVSEKIYDKNK